MNWSEHISVEQLLLVVFAAGALSMQIRGIAKSVNNLVEKAVPRIHSRIDELKSWQDRAEGRDEGVKLEQRRARVRTAALGVPTGEDDA